MVRGTIAAYGRLDCAFNNAGIGPNHVKASGKRTAEWTEEAFDRIIAVDLRGVWLCMKETIAYMQAHGGGVIINNASIGGLSGLPTSIGYVAAKHGVVGMTKTAALEYYEDKIRVNAVCPGFIESQLTQNTMRMFSVLAAPRRRFLRVGRPAEIAEMVVWLCSDRASYVNGAIYNIDGGHMAA
jgi:NAD(P)-dependent dehydrogenase (short-subunit alcohol dehydrogenase family)